MAVGDSPRCRQPFLNPLSRNTCDPLRCQQKFPIRPSNPLRTTYLYLKKPFSLALSAAINRDASCFWMLAKKHKSKNFYAQTGAREGAMVARLFWHGLF